MVGRPDQYSRALDSFGLVTITYVGRRYEITGENIDQDGQPLGNFRYYISEYNDYKLRYAYDGINNRHAGGHIEGYGEFLFTPARGGPWSFEGFIRDNYYGAPVVLHGEKIIQPHKYALQKPAVRAQLIQKLLNGELHTA